MKGHHAIAGERIALRDATGTFYLLSDRLGSIVAVLDASGMVVSEQRYRPFGQPRLDDSGSPTDLGFTGERELSGAGLGDFNARWFDVSLGMFGSADTWIPNPHEPQSLNRYGYVLNNPLRYTDPTGRRACEGSQGECWYEDMPVQGYASSPAVNTTTATSTSSSQTVQRRNDAVQTPADGTGAVVASDGACDELGADFRCGTVIASASLYGPPWMDVEDSDPREAWITERGAASVYYGGSLFAEEFSLFAEGNYYAHGAQESANLFVAANYSYTPYSLSIPSLSVHNYSNIPLGVDVLHETSDFRSYDVDRTPVFAHQSMTIVGPSVGGGDTPYPVITPINTFGLWVDVVVTVTMVGYPEESIPRIGTFTFLFPSGLSGSEPSWVR